MTGPKPTSLSKEDVETVYDDLEERDQLVLGHWYGIRGRSKETLESIGSICTPTIERQRVFQIKQRALERALDFLVARE